MMLQISCQLVVFLLCTILLTLSSTDAGPTYECELQKRDDENVCVFRNVMYATNITGVTFKAPAGKIQHVAFEDSSLEHLPKELLSAFPDLRSLSVPNTNLSSVIIPAKLERLYASDNQISRVIVHQTRDSTTMQELMLDSNNLQDVSNLTRLAKLEILNLSGNKDLAIEGTIELGRFKGMNGLRHLLLSDVGAYYFENENDVSLPELELLDLSNNRLLTSSLLVKVFAPLKSLQILRLGHNQLQDLDVKQLTDGNPQLKQIYLEGSHFKCGHQRLIVNHLHTAGVETPVTNRQGRCVLGFEKQDDMCCVAEMTFGSGTPGTQTPKVLPRPSDEEGNRITDRTSISTSTDTVVMVHNKERTTSTVTPPATVPKSNDGKNGATMVTLGNTGWFGVLLVTAIVKLILF
ncbi:toll-like receptor 9 [Anopheles marshallii]|uniref:toll-like receptor 9 n=1 Tax=Anopheles marshallii TaxID=1521116 RepID=UPI00237C4DFC|nr:toll-like receptor 9 [Anopheles marshallii]